MHQMNCAMRKRAVITGVGMVTPLGLDVAATWDRMLRGESGIGYITIFDASTFPVRIAGEVKGFDDTIAAVPEAVRHFAGRATTFCLAATQEALQHARFAHGSIEPPRIGISLGASEETYTLSRFDDAFVAADIYQHLAGSEFSYLKQSKPLGHIWPVRKSAHITSQIIAMIFGARGPSSASSTACASSTHAVGKALRMIEYGDADMVIAGGTDSCLSEFSVAGFYLLGALSENNSSPSRASRPFDLKRNGFVLAEGSGILIVEELQHALQRGAPILAELKGFGASSNSYRITDSPPDGRGPDQAMITALQDAGMSPGDIDHINAHGTSTVINDRSETLAIKKVFGERAYRIPVTANKSMLGHSIAGAGAIELIVSVLTIQHNVIPPTINYEVKDPDCDLDYVPNEKRNSAVNAVLSNSFAFGGQNASLVVARYEGDMG
jgi:3-oxoacyl-[acyl-carrier-protein] synthase II